MQNQFQCIISFVSCGIIGVFCFLLALLARVDPPELINTIFIDIIIGGVIAFAVFSLAQFILFSNSKKIKISKILGIILGMAASVTLIFWQCWQLEIRSEASRETISEKHK